MNTPRWVQSASHSCLWHNPTNPPRRGHETLSRGIVTQLRGSLSSEAHFFHSPQNPCRIGTTLLRLQIHQYPSRDRKPGSDYHEGLHPRQIGAFILQNRPHRFVAGALVAWDQNMSISLPPNNSQTLSKSLSKSPHSSRHCVCSDILRPWSYQDYVGNLFGKNIWKDSYRPVPVPTLHDC